MSIGTSYSTRSIPHIFYMYSESLISQYCMPFQSNCKHSHAMVTYPKCIYHIDTGTCIYMYIWNDTKVDDVTAQDRSHTCRTFYDVDEDNSFLAIVSWALSPLFLLKYFHTHLDFQNLIAPKFGGKNIAKQIIRQHNP